VTNGWQTEQPSSPTTLTLNGFTSNAKHGFNFSKWSNMAWNSFSIQAIKFCILPRGDLQLPHREKTRSHSDIGKMTECF